MHESDRIRIIQGINNLITTIEAKLLQLRKSL